MSGPLRQATLTVTRARVTSAGNVLRPGRPTTTTVLDHGNGTFELDDGAAFRSVDGQQATRALLQPGATFSVGKNDEFLITVQSVTDWT